MCRVISPRACGRSSRSIRNKGPQTLVWGLLRSKYRSVGFDYCSLVVQRRVLQHNRGKRHHDERAANQAAADCRSINEVNTPMFRSARCSNRTAICSRRDRAHIPPTREANKVYRTEDRRACQADFGVQSSIAGGLRSSECSLCALPTERLAQPWLING